MNNKCRECDTTLQGEEERNMGVCWPCSCNVIHFNEPIFEKTMNEQQTLKVMILDFAYWLEANKHITNDADSLVDEYISFIDKQIGGVTYEKK